MNVQYNTTLRSQKCTEDTHDLHQIQRQRPVVNKSKCVPANGKGLQGGVHACTHAHACTHKSGTKLTGSILSPIFALKQCKIPLHRQNISCKKASQVT